MTIRSVDVFGEKITHRARMLSSLGNYPKEEILFRTRCGFFPHKEITFSFFPYSKLPDNAPYSEVQWLTKEEIRLYASIIMALDPSEGFLSFYPVAELNFYFDCSDAKILTKKHISYVRNIIRKRLESPYGRFIKQEGYVYGTEIDYKLALQIYETLNPSNPILMRGLSCLIKSAMLMKHIAFSEEAINTLFISLESSFRLMLEKLKENGISNPTSQDAANFLHDSFRDTERSTKYFEDYYQQRIVSFHPESRFGKFPYPPLSISDFFFLYADLIEVYRFLISGYINPQRNKEFA